MNIFVQTHDKGIHLIDAFQLLFNKYWEKQPVTILGYTGPDFELAPNFSFVSLGEDTGPKIGAQLIDFFSNIDDEHFVYTVYSQFIIRPVLTRLFEYLAHLIESSDRVVRIALTGDLECNQPYNYVPLQQYDEFRLVEYSQVANYRLSAIWSIWSTGYFIKYMQPDWDLWQWETIGSKMAKGDGAQVLTTFGKYALTPARIYKRGQPHADSFRSWDKFGAEMTQEDQAIVRPLMRGPTWAAAGEGVKC